MTIIIFCAKIYANNGVLGVILYSLNAFVVFIYTKRSKKAMHDIKFIKMHGGGNDYVYIDCFKENLSGINIPDLAIKISDRHFGVGGDGLVLICPCAEADAEMRMFNADGSEGNMCGNAIRCVGKYIFDSGYVNKNIVEIKTKSGTKKLTLNIKDNKAISVKVEMGKAEFECKKIPVIYDSENEMINKPVKIGGNTYNITCVSMGNPHCVVFTEEMPDIEKTGPLFENNIIFPDRVNTEFAHIISPDKIKMRVWERGSGETFACGTGACAVVSAAVKNGFCKAGKPVTVILKGGNLCITYTPDNVTMEGPAEIVFKGVYGYDK